jgi:hypothetical protein
VIKEQVVLRTPSLQVSTLLHRLAVWALIRDYQQDNSTFVLYAALHRESCSY